MRKGWWGDRVKDRSSLPGRQRPKQCRPCPPDFREIYIRYGWAAVEYYATSWRAVARWIDECGGEELIAERKEFFFNGRRFRRPPVRHARGWSAEKLKEHVGAANADGGNPSLRRP